MNYQQKLDCVNILEKLEEDRERCREFSRRKYSDNSIYRQHILSSHWQREFYKQMEAIDCEFSNEFYELYKEGEPCVELIDYLILVSNAVSNAIHLLEKHRKIVGDEISRMTKVLPNEEVAKSQFIEEWQDCEGIPHLKKDYKRHTSC